MLLELVKYLWDDTVTFFKITLPWSIENTCRKCAAVIKRAKERMSRV